VTTFLVETSKSLDTDYAKVTANLLVELVALQRAGANDTARAAVTAATINSSPTSSDVWINGLWFTSLILSLSTAVLAALAKQWLRQYTSAISGSARDRAFIRQFRWEGLEAWKVQAIIGVLPTILHASLGLFLAGVVVYLLPLHLTIAYISLGISIVLSSIYITSVILPLIFLQCPYRTQFSLILGSLFRWVGAGFLRLLYWAYSRGLRKCVPALEHPWGLFVARNTIVEWCKKGFKDQERESVFSSVKEIPVRAPELLLWLLQNTASSSAKQIIFQALGACTLRSDDDRRPFWQRIEWEGPMNKLIAMASSGQPLAQNEKVALLRLMRSAIVVGRGIDPPPRTVLPSMEHGFLATEAFFVVKSLSVSSPQGAVMLVQDTNWNPKIFLESYDPEDPYCLPHHTWASVKWRINHPIMSDESRPGWDLIIQEINEHLLDYLKPLDYPASHETPISMARFYAPAIGKLGWLGLEKAELDYLEWAFPELYDDYSIPLKRVKDPVKWKELRRAFGRGIQKLQAKNRVLNQAIEQPLERMLDDDNQRLGTPEDPSSVAFASQDLSIQEEQVQTKSDVDRDSHDSTNKELEKASNLAADVPENLDSQKERLKMSNMDPPV
jgi:hypothetical protein